MRKTGRRALIAALLLTAGSIASAHHSFSAFNRAESAKKTISGTVQEFSLINPHGWIKLSVPQAGKTANWSFEMASAGQLNKQGWTRSTLSYGDKITVTYFPLRFGSYGGQLISVTLGDGKTLQGLAEADRGYPTP